MTAGETQQTATNSSLGLDNAQLSSLYNRVKVFDHPFAYAVINARAQQFCNHCLRAPAAGEKLFGCGACNFSHYCNKECQRLAWKVHKSECARLKKVYPNLPMTEVLFLSKVVDRVQFLAQNGDRFGWERERKFSELMDHKEDIQKCEAKMAHFEKIFGKLAAFRDAAEMPSKEEFFDIFCKVSINSHSIHTNSGTEVGMSIDLGVSKYNHSCRPTCTMVFDGYQVFLRPLLPNIDAADLEKATISYVDIGRSRFQRRRDLKLRWYFHCECERCSDPEDDILTSLKCPNPECDQPILTSEEEEAVATAKTCPKCSESVSEAYVREGQEKMRKLPDRFSPNADNIDELTALLEEAERQLHPLNVYISRLRTALMHHSGTLKENLTFIQRQVYENYKHCFPKSDRHVGFQLMHIVETLLEEDKNEEAISYVFDAMNIFEVCFGLEHPYYLQTLALWTFLSEHIPKPKDELLRLCKYTDNRRIDVAALLAAAGMAVEVPTGNGEPSGV